MLAFTLSPRLSLSPPELVWSARHGLLFRLKGQSSRIPTTLKLWYKWAHQDRLALLRLPISSSRLLVQVWNFHQHNSDYSTFFAFSAGGAIVLEWNIHDPAGQQGAAGMWDTHIRLVSGPSPRFPCLTFIRYRLGGGKCPLFETNYYCAYGLSSRWNQLGKATMPIRKFKRRMYGLISGHSYYLWCHCLYGGPSPF